MILGARRPCPPSRARSHSRFRPHPHRQVIRLGPGDAVVAESKDFGDLLVEVQPQLPQDLQPREIELFRELADLRK
jgi:hypothetical protein